MRKSQNKPINRLFHLSIWFAIAAISIQLPIHSMVLCLGDDGHVSVEYSVQGNCSESPESHYESDHTVIAKNTPSPEHCGDCLDIALPSQNSKNVRLARQYSSMVSSLDAILQDTRILFVGISPLRSQLNTNIHHSPNYLTMQFLHSIVLVI